MHAESLIALFTPPFFTIITTLLIFVVIGHLLTQRKKPTSTIAWAFTIIAIPYIGIFFYILFHGRKIKKIMKNLKAIRLHNNYNVKVDCNSEIEKLLHKNGLANATSGNAFYICKDGVDSFSHLLQMLQEAQESIYILTYIFGQDAVTRKIIEILTAKAAAGVEVKLLIDAFGSQSLEFRPGFLKSLEAAGGEYHFFMSLIKEPMNSKLNLRNHRKMIVVDHDKVMSGGINISASYLALDHNARLWRDLSFILQGAAAIQYEEIFRYDWESDAKTKLRHYKRKKEEISVGESIVQVVPSGPDVDRDALYEALLLAIYEAKERIWVVSPYFAPDSSLVDALIVAKHRGVEIKIISPLSSDHFFVDIARSAFLRDLANEGIEILFFKNQMLHAKAFLVDEKCAVLGSSNFDSRSFFYNFEVVSFIYSKEDILAVKRWVELLFSECESGMKKASKIRLVIENFFKMFAPAV